MNRSFAGTTAMFRWYLRRDRLILPLWVLLLSLPLGSIFIGSIRNLYSTPADLASFAKSILSSASELAMYGPVYNASLGAVGMWKASMFDVIIAVAALLTVIRHTRAEEESARAELLAATALGRLAPLTAVLVLAGCGSLTAGILAGVSITAAGVPAAGAFAFGAGLAGAGLVFAAVGAVAAQVSASARGARGAGLAVLALAYILRAAGDMRAGDGPTNPLTWLSPLGWSLQIRPFAGDRWWVFGLHLCATAVLVALAYALLHRRDLGAGLFADRPGRAVAGRALSGPLGLAWRLQRGTVLAWTAGFAVYGALIGSVVHGIGGQLGDTPAATEILTRLGGTHQLEAAVLTAMFGVLGIAAAAMSTAAVLRLSGEEVTGRAEPVLATAVSRLKWACAHAIIAVAGPALALCTAGALAGLLYGAAIGDVPGEFGRVLATALVQLPAVWVFTGATLLLFGVVPRFATAAWGLLSGVVALFVLGSIAGFPQLILDISPFAHVPKLPAGAFSLLPVVVLVAVAAVFAGTGLAGLQRRDVR